MLKLKIKSFIYTLCCLLILTAYADNEVNIDDKSVLIGDWTYIAPSANTFETSYYPNGISKVVIYSKTINSQVLGYGIANWYIDTDSILHTLFIDQSSTDLGLVTGAEILDKIIVIDSNHIQLMSTTTEEIKDLYRA